jgi:hypothetical protein
MLPSMGIGVARPLLGALLLAGHCACAAPGSAPAPGPAPTAAVAAVAAGPAVPRSEARLVSDAPPRPPPDPVPPPTPGEAKSLDELLAVVEGDVITRQRLVKIIGERAPGETEAEYERKTYRALLQRAQTSVVVKAATRMGLSVPPDMLDAFVVRHSRALVDEVRAKSEKAKPGSGASITFEKILVERGQTMEDYRAERSDEMLIRNYFRVLAEGVPGKRAQLDFEASPSDIRRLYEAHRSRFDVQPGVRIAYWLARPTDYFGKQDLTYDQAKALATRELEAAVEDYRRGESADAITRKRGFAEGAEFAPGKWRERVTSKKAPPEIDEWLFDAARKPGDARVFPLDDPLAMVVVEIRPARSRTFSEVEPELAETIREVRRKRFTLTHTLELLGHATIQSKLPVLDDLQAMARSDLKALDENEVFRDIRLR